MTAPKENQDFSGQVTYYSISGTTGTPGVKLSGIPGDPVSNDKGQYTAQVEYGWSGIVTPQGGSPWQPLSGPHHRRRPSPRSR